MIRMRRWLLGVAVGCAALALAVAAAWAFQDEDVFGDGGFR